MSFQGILYSSQSLWKPTRGGRGGGGGVIKSGKWADIVYACFAPKSCWRHTLTDMSILLVRCVGRGSGGLFDFSKIRAYFVDDWWWTSSFEKPRMMCLLMIFYFCSPLKLSFMKRIATGESISMHCWFGKDALNPRTITYPFVNELNTSMVRFFFKDLQNISKYGF